MTVTPRVLGGRYRVEELVGSGGMSLVYRGHDAQLERTVAIKLLADNLAADAALRSRFEREARIVARLAHPNVVRVYDVGEAEGRPYFVMEYVAGETLAQLLRRRGRLLPGEVAVIGAGVCAGLDHAHRLGLVHRDVKPSNILLDPGGQPKIADFGIARALDTSAVTETGGILGTAAYIAPEQAAGEQVAAPADLYALGVVLFELLVGRPPFDVSTVTQALLARERTPLPPLGAGVPAGLEAAVRRCLERDPDRRPTASELAAALAAVVEELPTGEICDGYHEERGTSSAEPATVAPTRARTRVTEPIRARRASPSRSRRRLVPVASSLLALAIGSVVVLLALGSGHSQRPVERPAPLPSAPVDQARALSTWLRAHAR